MNKPKQHITLEGFKDSFATELFGMTKNEAHRQGICISCKRAIDLSSMKGIDKREYEISGLCSECFDNITREK